VQKIVAGEVKDVAGMIPVGEDAGNDGEEHVIRPVNVDDLWRPERGVGRGQWNRSLADIRPVRAAVGGLGDAEVCAVNPCDAARVGEVGAAIGVEHPPTLASAIPHNDRIGSTIVNRIAKERNACHGKERGKDFKRYIRIIGKLIRT
jgi:hypothetical protein